MSSVSLFTSLTIHGYKLEITRAFGQPTPSRSERTLADFGPQIFASQLPLGLL